MSLHSDDRAHDWDFVPRYGQPFAHVMYAAQSGLFMHAVTTWLKHGPIPPSAVWTALFRHVSHASPVVTIPVMQYSVAHCVWHAPIVPHAHDWTSITRF